jgi:hypothetical protein
MLLTVAIIVLLIAMLLPQLSKAKRAAYIVKCLSNLHSHGVGFNGYLRDHFNTFALTKSWTDLSGKAGDPAMNPTNLYGAKSIPYEQRPLNKYLGSAESSQCPADLGDSYDSPAFGTITNCFQAFGNSYQAPFSYDVLRTKKVFGQVSAAGAVTSKPARYKQFAQSFSTKVIQGDFVWWGNRRIEFDKSRWHSEGAQRQYCMLFADWHASFTTFPFEQEAYWPASDPLPNPANLWW